MRAMSEALATVEMSGPLRPADVINQIKLIQEVMSAVMKENEHYGKIPGCGTKPTLLQPGAQVLALTFRLAPSFYIDINELDLGHREYMVKCQLSSASTGQLIGMGVGSCSTLESKYRYRNVSDFELTGEPIPADSKERKAEYRKQGFGMKKVNDVWEWVRFKDSDKVENPDIADTYNTVLKMASKRAFVHAVLNTTAASDMFTQDIEDLMSAPETEAPAIDEKTLGLLRSLRDEANVSMDIYAKQLEHYRVSVDTSLRQAHAEELIAAYQKRIADQKATPEATEEVAF